MKTNNPLWSYSKDIPGTYRPGFPIGFNGVPAGLALFVDLDTLGTSRADLLTKFRALRDTVLADPRTLEGA